MVHYGVNKTFVILKFMLLKCSSPVTCDILNVVAAFFFFLRIVIVFILDYINKKTNKNKHMSLV